MGSGVASAAAEAGKRQATSRQPIKHLIGYLSTRDTHCHCHYWWRVFLHFPTLHTLPCRHWGCAVPHLPSHSLCLGTSMHFAAIRHLYYQKLSYGDRDEAADAWLQAVDMAQAVKSFRNSNSAFSPTTGAESYTSFFLPPSESVWKIIFK